MIVGTIILSAAVGNDIGLFSLNFCNIPTFLMISTSVGWILLAHGERWSTQAIAYLCLISCLHITPLAFPENGF
jgi:hypothetical protein